MMDKRNFSLSNGLLRKFSSGGKPVMATYKIDGAKFQTLEELKESLWPFYDGKITREDFEKHINENVKKEEK